jgi:hypothetical protein
MADYSRSKKRIASAWPSRASDGGAGGYSRGEAFLTPERLKNEFLFGIPLKSPLTGETMSDDTLKSIIRKAAGEVELRCKVDIFKTQRVMRLEFDRTKWAQGFGQLDLGYPNIYSVEEISIRTVESQSTENPNPAPEEEDGKLIYRMPLAWIDLDSMGHKGVIHTVPLQTSYTGVGQVGSYNGAAAAILTVFQQLRFMPAFWYAKFTTGFDDNSVPGPINNLIGYRAALMILSMLGPTQKYSSKSIGIDGASQSLGGPGNQQFALRAQDLEKQIAELELSIKSYFGSKIFMSHI